MKRLGDCVNENIFELVNKSKNTDNEKVKNNWMCVYLQ